MQICIIIDFNRHLILNVEPTDRVIYLKTKISEQLGIPLDQQQILYQGKSLDNENTLSYYSIKNDSELHLNQQKLVSISNNSKTTIIVTDITGQNHFIEIDLKTRISDLIKIIADKTNMKSCNQQVFYGNNILNDKCTLQDYSINKFSHLYIIQTLKGDKPVIYLYPEKDNFDVSVNIDMKKENGEITSIYPVIKGSDKNTWIIKANKNGEIIYNNRKYYYLFWECNFNQTFKIDEGFCIEGEKCFEFFEEKLEYLGFKVQEANDFITYWCPKMEHSNYVLINFQDEDYNKRVPLTIEPKPDSIKRIFMTFKLIQNKVEIPIQNLEKFKINERKGFFVFEWGGSQVL